MSLNRAWASQMNYYCVRTVLWGELSDSRTFATRTSTFCAFFFLRLSIWSTLPPSETDCVYKLVHRLLSCSRCMLALFLHLILHKLERAFLVRRTVSISTFVLHQRMISLKVNHNVSRSKWSHQTVNGCSGIQGGQITLVFEWREFSELIFMKSISLANMRADDDFYN